MTFKYFWKCKVSLQHKVTAGTGVMLTGQASITPEAFPSVSSNPNRAFGISSVLESLMSLALDLCLLMLSLVCLQKITAVPVLFLPFPVPPTNHEQLCIFAGLIHLLTLLDYKDVGLRMGKSKHFWSVALCCSLLRLRSSAESLGKGWVITLFAILVYISDCNREVLLFIQEQSCKRSGISNCSMARAGMKAKKASSSRQLSPGEEESQQMAEVPFTTSTTLGFISLVTKQLCGTVMF